MHDAKLDAFAYLLTLIVQRMESERPGFIEELMTGVSDDLTAIDDRITNRKHIEAIFAETHKLLERAAGK
jgi:hypothetical protein